MGGSTLALYILLVTDLLLRRSQLLTSLLVTSGHGFPHLLLPDAQVLGVQVVFPQPLAKLLIGEPAGLQQQRKLLGRLPVAGPLITVVYLQRTIVHSGLPAVDRGGGDTKLGGYLPNCLALRG